MKQNLRGVQVMRSLRCAVFGCVLGFGIAQAAVVVDSFQDPLGTTLSAIPASPSVSTYQTGLTYALGGTRFADLSLQSPTGSVTLLQIPNSLYYLISNGGDGRFGVAYGFDASGAPAADWNLDVYDGNGTFGLELIFEEPSESFYAGVFDVTFYTGLGGTETPASYTISDVPLPVQGETYVWLPYSGMSFDPSIVFDGQLDAMSFDFDPDAAVPYTLDLIQFTMVPEPSSLALLALMGLVGLGRRRRRS